MTATTPLRLLIVDDEREITETLAEGLGLLGRYEVRTCHDGLEALGEVSRFAPHVVLLDLDMPGLDGAGVMARLREEPRTARLPIVVITAILDPGDSPPAPDDALVAMLAKPVSIRSVAEAIDALLSVSDAS